MADTNYRDFSDDENIKALQEMLAEAKSQSKIQKNLFEQSEASLSLFEKITTESAIKLAEQQSRLTDLTEKLNETKKELARHTDLMNQQEMITKAKAYTLQTAQKELEDSQMRYCQTIEVVNKINASLQEYEDEIQKTSIQVKSAYNNWQHNYKHLQEKKNETEETARNLELLKSQIDNLSHKQELGKNNAADILADDVISVLDDDLDITDMCIKDLPVATLNKTKTVPTVPPMSEELAKLIKEVTEIPDDDHQSLSANIPEENNAEADSQIDDITYEEQDSIEKDFWDNTQSIHPTSNIFYDKPNNTFRSEEPKEIPENSLTVDTEKTEKTEQDKDSKDNKDTEKENNDSAKSEIVPSNETVTDNNTNTENEKNTKNSIPVTLFKYFLCIVIAVVLAFLLKNYVFQITSISGNSMEPTLHSGEISISSKIGYYFNDVHRGDIIVFRAPDKQDKTYYVKRVIGVPGDHVVIQNGNIEINGEIFTEDYLPDNIYTNGTVNTLVPENQYFVLGDNRQVSHDSRNEEVGTISYDAIIGKTNFVIFPFDQIGPIN